MKAPEFNHLYEKIILDQLVSKYHFIRKNRDLFIEKNNSYFAIFRKHFRGLRVAEILLCVRHPFTRDLYNQSYNLIQENPDCYPFKISPLELEEEKLKNWHYQPRYYALGGGFKGFELNFGEENEKLYGEIPTDIPQLLEKIYTLITTNGFEWVEKLTPEESLLQLKKYNNGDPVEIDWWIKDYEEYLKSH